uniref:Uncharacterized protein n=1 Tax=Eutreptiella gymnastica TaxID=73025 RepID=A0A7S1IVJ9_9EUGL
MAYNGEVYTLIGEQQSAGSVNSKTVLAIASVAAVALGSFMVTRDYIIPQTNLHVQPTVASVSQGAAAAVAIGMATAANPAMAEESLLDSLGAQYTPGFAQQASKSGSTELPKGKGRAALSELTKEVKAAPSIFDTPVKKPQQQAEKKPSAKKPATYVSQPLPERKAAKKPAGPGYGNGKTLPSVVEDVPAAKVKAAEPVAAAPVAEPAAAPAKESKGIGFFGKKPAAQADAPAPASAPAKGTAKYPTVAKKASKTKEAAPVTVQKPAGKPGTPTKPVKVEKKGSVKKEDPKKTKKDDKKKKSGGNPLLGPLALIGGIYGLGVYAGKEEEEAASQDAPAVKVEDKTDEA